MRSKSEKLSDGEMRWKLWPSPFSFDLNRSNLHYINNNITNQHSCWGRWLTEFNAFFIPSRIKKTTAKIYSSKSAFRKWNNKLSFGRMEMHTHSLKLASWLLDVSIQTLISYAKIRQSILANLNRLSWGHRFSICRNTLDFRKQSHSMVFSTII